MRDDLPTRFLGLNYKRGQQGELIVDCQHYVENMQIPDSKQFAKLAKQDLLSNKLQSTFKDMTSKVNALAYTIRPDIMYATKYLSTRKGKATKSDMTQLMKIIKKKSKIQTKS